MDHWSFYIRSRQLPDTGVVVHATGDVASGFRLEIKRCFPVNEPLNTVAGEGVAGKKVVLKNCQSWVIESADQLVLDKMLSPEVAAYLRAIEQ